MNRVYFKGHGYFQSFAYQYSAQLFFLLISIFMRNNFFFAAAWHSMRNV